MLLYSTLSLSVLSSDKDIHHHYQHTQHSINLTIRPVANGFPSRLPLNSRIFIDIPITPGSASSNRYGSLAGSVCIAAGPRFDCCGGLDTYGGLRSAESRWHLLMLVTSSLTRNRTDSSIINRTHTSASFEGGCDQLCWLEFDSTFSTVNESIN